jgi:hypothetical protein
MFAFALLLLGGLGAAAYYLGVIAPVQREREPTREEQPDFVGTWQCIDPNTHKLLMTVTFNADFTYKEWRGGQIISGDYKYNKQTNELSFVYVNKNRGGREDVMELGRVTPINKMAFQFKVMTGHTLLPGSIYEFSR